LSPKTNPTNPISSHRTHIITSPLPQSTCKTTTSFTNSQPNQRAHTNAGAARK
jgi:hypothetical protein